MTAAHEPRSIERGRDTGRVDDPPIITRPGPAAILPGMIPGGVVIHVYAVPTGRHLLTRMTRSAAETEHHATEDADAAMAALTAG